LFLAIGLISSTGSQTRAQGEQSELPRDQTLIKIGWVGESREGKPTNGLYNEAAPAAGSLAGRVGVGGTSLTRRARPRAAGYGGTTDPNGYDRRNTMPIANTIGGRHRPSTCYTRKARHSFAASSLARSVRIVAAVPGSHPSRHGRGPRRGNQVRCAGSTKHTSTTTIARDRPLSHSLRAYTCLFFTVNEEMSILPLETRRQEALGEGEV
jgi:hypothetical protein